MFQLTPTVKALLIMNLVIFVMTNFIFPEAMQQFALYGFQSDKFRGYQLFTHMFLHAGWGHIFSNMFSLFIFGPMLEYRWGGNRFLVFYLVCGLGASLLYQGIRTYEIMDMKKDVAVYAENPSPLAFSQFLDEHLGGRYNPEAVAQYKREADNQEMVQATIESVKSVYNDLVQNGKMVGASGAVFALLMAFGMLFPNTELMLLFFPFPIKAKYFVLFYGAYELYAGLARNPGDNVAHFAHLGGMLFAYILLKIWERHDRKNFY
ncbi:rhomboid family intramembrane serine protease [Adhaeribacter sp. BT258]|uniref:Rhomboid family intramembrane serine protease n=1 Tax=Adhaeribacter terrigena TaxID=2793070 RepID=A0ABS1BXI9_9BACT|nr:rhomboid family intramembrane serine protease [Adhaeribacter terrigena]MBK0401753.1 rhomboid family intramembrane serine protease [Adhaeribacter terrigena]